MMCVNTPDSMVHVGTEDMARDSIGPIAFCGFTLGMDICKNNK